EVAEVAQTSGSLPVHSRTLGEFGYKMFVVPPFCGISPTINARRTTKAVAKASVRPQSHARNAQPQDRKLEKMRSVVRQQMPAPITTQSSGDSLRGHRWVSPRMLSRGCLLRI